MDRDLRATTPPAAGPVGPPDQGASVTWDEWRPPAPPGARSVPLGELLTIAGLTPAQAALVIADLLQAMGQTPPEHVQVALRADGGVDLTAVDTDLPGAALREQIDDVVRNARRLPAHPHPHQLSLMRHIEEQVGATGDPAERAAALREALVEEVGPDAVTRTRRELAALLEAFGGIAVSRSATSVRVNGHAVASPVVQPRVPRPRTPAPRPLVRRRARPRRMLMILGVLALALVAVGYVFLRSPVSDLIDDVRGGSTQASTHQPPPPSHQAGHHHTHHGATHHTGTFPTLAAHSSGSVQGVVLQAINGCSPGTACGVKVTVHLTASSASQVVGWRVGVVRNCARPVTWAPETTITAQPGWTTVFASSSVPIPNGRSLALVALTTTPNHAQSQPIPVGGTPLHC